MQEPYDPSRQIPDRVNVADYQSCYVNVTTMFRNLVAAIAKETFLAANAKALAATLEEEIGVIQSLFQTEGRNLCKVHFYYSDYRTLRARNIPGLSFRDPSTEGQRHYHALLEDTLKVMERHTDTIRKFHDAIEPEGHEKAFAFTHQPYDLTSYKRFAQLDLLESNTGVLKPKSRWNSKYCAMSGQSFVHLPFNRKILLIFGDRVLIKPFPTVLRKQILDTSLNRGWSPATTDDKIKLDLGFDIKDPYAMAIINSL